MKNINLLASITCLSLLLFSCTGERPEKNHSQPVHHDTPFLQDYSVKYYFNQHEADVRSVQSDRNGIISVLTSNGLFRPHGGQFLYPGTLEKDRSDMPTSDKNIAGITLYNNQFVYVDDSAVLSNAWAGKLFTQHEVRKASVLAGGKDFIFLLSDGRMINCVNKKEVLWTGISEDEVLDITYDPDSEMFWLLGKNTLSTFSANEKKLHKVFDGENFTCFTFYKKVIIIGTTDGYITFDPGTRAQKGEIAKQLPSTDLTTVSSLDDKLWFGSNQGAFMLREDGKYNYYASERWIPGDSVVHISSGPENSTLILTKKGLGQIYFKSMTLQEKADYFEKQVRARHIRLGFNAGFVGMKPGNLSTGYMPTSDNDGLWTSMYLGSQVFRYAVTKSEEALENCRESLDAMERLYTINKIPGFPSRSFDRRGYKYDNWPWRRADDPEWDWKSTTSSDEAIGHIFVFSAMAELIDDEDIKQRSIVLIDSLMQHVVDNDFYLIDWNGEPTLWGKWHPDYVNARPTMVGDRKLNSSNIIAMLQTAYHFTKKEVYKEKAFDLMQNHGYLENLMRPIGEIGQAPETADELSRNLSENWNHSDDEMYFLGYWGLYRYAFNDSLRDMYKRTIIEHWEIERPEKEGLWNIFTALTGTASFDLENAIWYLQEYPLDLIGWSIKNSHRKDIEKIEENFRGQTIKEVLPPDELRIVRHNSNTFVLDAGGGGTYEESAGDIWLLPYWLGRYLGVIDGKNEK